MSKKASFNVTLQLMNILQRELRSRKTIAVFTDYKRAMSDIVFEIINSNKDFEAKEILDLIEVIETTFDMEEYFNEV